MGLWQEKMGIGMKPLKNLSETEKQKLLIDYPCATSVAEAYFMLCNDMKTQPMCPVCNQNKVKFSRGSFTKTCSKSCSNRLPENNHKRNNARKQAVIEKYGVENVMQIKHTKEKQKQTVIEKYGVDNIFKAESTKQKIIETNLSRYGVDHISKLPEQQEKKKANPN